MRLSISFSTLTIPNLKKERSFNQIQTKCYCTCLVNLDIVHSTANLSKRWDCVGFKFANSVGSGRALFNQTVYSHKAFRCFLASSSLSLVSNIVWKNKQKSKY